MNYEENRVDYRDLTLELCDDIGEQFEMYCDGDNEVVVVYLPIEE